MRVPRIPLSAWPALLRWRVRRQFPGPLPPAELSEADLDFFIGGTDAVAERIAAPAFRFFAPDTFGPPPSPGTVEAVLSHHIDLLGETFGVGHPIQWRRDFRSRHEWPREPVARLQLVTTAGDVKTPWELSRFQHGLVLARAYTATGDSRCPSEWFSQFQQWRADNPPEVGPNWGNAMEAAIRAANWIAAYSWLRPALSNAAGEAFLKALIQHGRFISRHLEEYWPPTNHLIADLCGLVWIGLFLRPKDDDNNASPEPKRWLENGLAGLEGQLRRQVLPDGADYEASTAYHRFVTEMVSGTVQLAQLNGLRLPRLAEIAARMEAVTAGLRKPDGTLPLFGDEDGGIFPCPSAAPVPLHHGWLSFPRGGWYIYRQDQEYLAVRAGDNGQAGQGGHAHNDALSFEYALGSRAFLVDPGTFAYTADPDSRNLFRSTAYHNTVRLDGQEISRIPLDELFRLENDVRAGGRASEMPPGWAGQHTGYRRLGVLHQRCFEKGPAGWRIEDTVTGKGRHDLEWFFHFAAGSPVHLDGLSARTAYPAGPNLRVTPVDAATLLQGTLETGWVSAAYGRRDPAPVVRYQLSAELPVTVAFIITLT